MNKVITINLGGTAYQLEEGGYDALRIYLETAAARLQGNPDRDEILSDVEQAIGEKFRALVNNYKTVVITKEVTAVLAEMGPIEDDSNAAENAATADNRGGATEAGGAARPAGTPGMAKRLYRINEGAMLAGVCNGLAAYLLGNLDIKKLSILAGVRMERTKVTGEGALQLITPAEKARRAAWVGVVTDAELTRRNIEEFSRRQTRTGKYTTVLPGVHLKYTPLPKLVTRLSYAENIGRPNVGSLIPRTTVDYDNQTISSSNPSLKPQSAKNYDLSAEFYFEPAGTISVGVFRKDLKGFIYTASGAIVASGADNGFNGDYAGFSQTTQYNGGSARVQGYEINFAQQFTSLPGFWAGFGAFANYTRMTTEGNYGAGNAIALAPNPVGKIAGFNPMMANAGISYIRDKVTLRLSANHRARFLATYNAIESRQLYRVARTQVDLKMLYQISRKIDVYLDVNNLLNGYDRQSEFEGGRPQTVYYLSPSLIFGTNVRL